LGLEQTESIIGNNFGPFAIGSWKTLGRRVGSVKSGNKAPTDMHWTCDDGKQSGLILWR